MDIPQKLYTFVINHNRHIWHKLSWKGITGTPIAHSHLDIIDNYIHDLQIKTKRARPTILPSVVCQRKGNPLFRKVEPQERAREHSYQYAHDILIMFISLTWLTSLKQVTSGNTVIPIFTMTKKQKQKYSISQRLISLLTGELGFHKLLF